jgi:transcriptional regulator with XRE-family HTH domain
MTQPALSRLEAGGVVPTIPLLERISAALDADLIVEIAPPWPEPEPTDRPQLRTLVVCYARPTG